MRFLKSDDVTYYTIKAITYTPNILINYKLVELSSRKYRTPGDRGTNTDHYSTSITFRGGKAYIRELVTDLTALRRSKQVVIIDQFEENVFGDNINHTGSISCLVGELHEEESPAINVQQIIVEFLATDVSTIGDTGIPTKINCLNTEWKGYSVWNTKIHETYNRNNYFVDHEQDTYEFEGMYVFDIEDNQKILNYWKTQRGVSFTINDGDWGTEYMFGPDAGNTTHDVIIKDISYSRFSATMRKVAIQMIKVG